MKRKSAKPLEDILKKIEDILLMAGIPDHRTLRRHYCSLFHFLKKEHGLRTAVSQLKALYNEALRFAAGAPIEPVTPIWCKRSKDNYPLILRPYKSFLTGSVDDKRYALSILRAFESYQLEPIKDWSSITEPSNGKAYYTKELEKDFTEFTKTSRFSLEVRNKFNESISKVKTVLDDSNLWHFSTKKGVGGPAILTAGKESLVLDENMISNLNKLLSYFKKNSSLIGYFIKINKEYYKTRDDVLNPSPQAFTHTGRICFLSDKGGKTRVIAIINYWIQDVMKLLHDTLYSILRSMPQDGTYNQSRVSSKVMKITEKSSCWSYDLTKATDRFPLSVQVTVLNSLADGLGTTWENILSGINFICEGQTIKYAVGQPMGLYSSWAAFALTHHYIIQYCARKEGKRFPFNSYVVLGDDVAIWDKDVAYRYREMLNKLDVKISLAKSFTPTKVGQNPHIAEFAKRLFVDGKEISPMPPDIAKSFKGIYNIPDVLEYLLDHNFLPEPVPVSRIINIFRIKPKDVDNLLCLFRVREVLGTPLRVNLDIPESINYKYITLDNVILYRKEILSKRRAELEEAYKYFYFGQLQEALEKRLGQCTYVMMENRPLQAILRNRMAVIDRFLKKIDEFLKRSSTDPQEPPPLDECEYTPILNPSKVESLCKGPSRTRIQKGAYIRNLLDYLKQDRGSPN